MGGPLRWWRAERFRRFNLTTNEDPLDRQAEPACMFAPSGKRKTQQL